MTCTVRNDDIMYSKDKPISTFIPKNEDKIANDDSSINNLLLTSIRNIKKN